MNHSCFLVTFLLLHFFIPVIATVSFTTSFVPIEKTAVIILSGPAFCCLNDITVFKYSSTVIVIFFDKGSTSIGTYVIHSITSLTQSHPHNTTPIINSHIFLNTLQQILYNFFHYHYHYLSLKSTPYFIYNSSILNIIVPI